VRRSINRTAALALCATLALGVAAVPCAAGETAGTPADGKLTRLSPASRQVLVTAPVGRSASPLASPLASPKLRSSEGGKLRSSEGGQPAGAPGGDSSFFKTTRGKVTLVLMGAGVGLTLYSIQHDRKPVKSPIR
jgi:hypothetical protein